MTPSVATALGIWLPSRLPRPPDLIFGKAMYAPPLLPRPSWFGRARVDGYEDWRGPSVLDETHSRREHP